MFDKIIHSVTNLSLRFYATRKKFAGTAFGRPPQLAQTTCGFFLRTCDMRNDSRR